jgi:hypothetical protein
MSNPNTEKEVNHERFASFKNLAGLSPCPFEEKYHPDI